MVIIISVRLIEAETFRTTDNGHGTDKNSVACDTNSNGADMAGNHNNDSTVKDRGENTERTTRTN